MQAISGHRVARWLLPEIYNLEREPLRVVSEAVFLFSVVKDI